MIHDSQKAELVQKINTAYQNVVGHSLTKKEVEDYMKMPISTLEFELSRLRFQDEPDLSNLY
jgi:hypothetical protein